MSFSLLEGENLERRRFIFSSTSYVEVDEQGRFVIPKNLLDYAKLDKKAVIIGVGDHFEIWDSAGWESYQSNMKN
jgi:MraZ protein